MSPPFLQSIRAWLGPKTAAGAIRIEDHLVGQLLPEELAAVKNAVLKRKREFAAGRILARQLMQQLGLSEAPLLAAADRAPLWPRGVTGTISHADDWCSVAVARAEDVRSLGLDLEEDTPLQPELFPLIATSKERDWLDGRADYAKLLFGAKEAFYKAQRPITGLLLDFQDVELELQQDTFAVKVLKPEAARKLRGAGLRVHFSRENGLWISGMTIDHFSGAIE